MWLPAQTRSPNHLVLTINMPPRAVRTPQMRLVSLCLTCKREQLNGALDMTASSRRCAQVSERMFPRAVTTRAQIRHKRSREHETVAAFVCASEYDARATYVRLLNS